MIYQIRIDGVNVYDTVAGRQVIKAQADVELNGAGSCDITLPYNHESYNLPVPMKSNVDIIENGNIIWFGRVTDTSINWNNEKKISCEGALAYFNDSILRPHTWTNEYLYTVFEEVIGMHNDQVSTDKQFTIGTIDSQIPNDKVTRSVDYTKTYEVLQEQFIKAIGGYIFLRRVQLPNEEYVNYIDWYKEVPYNAGQDIEFGINLLNLIQNFVTSDIITGIIPLGDDGNGNRVTIRNASATVETGYSIHDDYIQNDDAVDQFGLILEAVSFNDVSNQSILVDQGLKYLKNKQFDHLSFECDVAELKYLDPDKAAFFVGQNVHVYSVPHRVLDKVLAISKISYDISASSKKITVGTAPRQDISSITGDAQAISTSGGTTVSGGSGSSGGGGGGGSSVTVTPIILTGDSIATMMVDGATYTLKYDASAKADKSDTYTKTEVNALIADIDTGATAVELTKAEYDELTEEEKNDPTVVYYVKDYPVISNPNDYSTTETLIGSWVDGNDIYQKTFNVDYAISTQQWYDLSNVVIIGLRKLIAAKFWGYGPNSLNDIGLNSLLYTRQKTGTNNIEVYPQNTTFGTLYIKNVTIQYTKSSDSGTTLDTGTFTTGSTVDSVESINCGFEPTYAFVVLPFTSNTYALYSSDISTTTSIWWILQERSIHTLTLGASSGETGICDITQTGFDFRAHGSNTLNKQCTYISRELTVNNSISGTFVTGSTADSVVDVNCGFEPAYVMVILPFSASVSTYAMYDEEFSDTTSMWMLPSERNLYTLTLGASSGETGICEITSTGFRFRAHASNTRNVTCTFSAMMQTGGE